MEGSVDQGRDGGARAGISGIRITQSAEAVFASTHSVMTAITAALPETPLALLLIGKKDNHCFSGPHRCPAIRSAARVQIHVPCTADGPRSAQQHNTHTLRYCLQLIELKFGLPSNCV